VAEERLPYSKGTIKLTWINPSDYSILESKMFNSIKEALANIPASRGNNWLLFQLVETDGTQYKWKLLPYGKHRGYINGMKLRDNPVLKYGAIALMIYGAYSLYQLMMVE
jgi:hypothetical protein